TWTGDIGRGGNRGRSANVKADPRPNPRLLRSAAGRARVAPSPPLRDRAPLLQPRDPLPVVAELEEDLLGVLADLGHRPLRLPAVDGEVDGRGDARDVRAVGLRHVDEGSRGDRLRVADDVLGRLHGR